MVWKPVLGCKYYRTEAGGQPVDYRVLFCIHDKTMVLLHSLKKGTGKTPKGDIELARRRQKEVGK